VECPAGAVPDFGIGETENFPATFDCAVSLIAATGYGQLRMNTAFPFWNAKRASSSCQVRDVRAVQFVAHELECAHRFGPVYNDIPLFVDDASAESSEVLDETRDESLVARTLPYDSVARAARPRHRRPRVRDHLLERLRLARHQIGAAVEKPDIGKPRKRVELPRPRIRLDCGGKEFATRRSVSRERQHPPRRRELRCPDDVELENGGIPDSRVEPLHIELMPLRRVVGSALELDPDPRVELRESLELLGDERPLGPEGGTGEG